MIVDNINTKNPIIQTVMYGVMAILGKDTRLKEVQIQVKNPKELLERIKTFQVQNISNMQINKTKKYVSKLKQFPKNMVAV